MKLNKKKLLSIIIPVFILICGLIIVSGYEKWDIGLSCPKCLQEASLHQIRIHGIIISSSLHLYKNPYEPKKSLDSNDAELMIFPALYEQILGEKCNHVFKKGGFGKYKWKVHGDGTFVEILPYQQRINAIEELYRAFLRCKNINLAKETYLLIDNALPIANDKVMINAFGLFRSKNEMPLENYESYSKEVVRIARSMQWLENITPRLKEIQTEEQWKDFLSETVKTIETNKNKK